MGLPDYKPVSVPRRAAVIPLGQPLLPGSCNLPESRTERAAPPLLFGLAPHGVYPAGRIAPSAVRSYRTISPLPPVRAEARISGGIFSVALSVKPALSESPRPLAGMLPYGDRTFLSARGEPLTERPPVRQACSYCLRTAVSRRLVFLDLDTMAFLGTITMVYLWIALGSALGGATRYWFYGFAARMWAKHFLGARWR